jgi:hypothetical protein
MFEITEDMVSELAKINPNEKTVRFVLCKALNSIPNKDYHTREWVIKVAKRFLPSAATETVVQDVKKFQKTPKKKVGRKPLNRGKIVLGGANFKSFWKNEKALEWALDDSLFPQAQPKGNYMLVKNLLRGDWKHKFSFSAIELRKEMERRHPERIGNDNAFKVQRWGDAMYWETTGEMASKPLWKKISRKEYQNIFYVGDSE